MPNHHIFHHTLHFFLAAFSNLAPYGYPPFSTQSLGTLSARHPWGPPRSIFVVARVSGSAGPRWWRSLALFWRWGCTGYYIIKKNTKHLMKISSNEDIVCKNLNRSKKNDTKRAANLWIFWSSDFFGISWCCERNLPRILGVATLQNTEVKQLLRMVVN